jgi:hypothetical protein
VSHIIGIPILWTNPGWSHRDAFAIGLCWHSPSVGERLDHLPSWTWAGWKLFSRPYPFHYYYGQKCPPELTFDFESRGGCIMKWQEFENNGDTMLATGKYLPHYLIIQSWVCTCGLSSRMNQYGMRVWNATFKNALGTHHTRSSFNREVGSTRETRSFRRKD